MRRPAGSSRIPEIASCPRASCTPCSSVASTPAAVLTRPWTCRRVCCRRRESASFAQIRALPASECLGAAARARLRGLARSTARAGRGLLLLALDRDWIAAAAVHAALDDPRPHEALHRLCATAWRVLPEWIEATARRHLLDPAQMPDWAPLVDIDWETTGGRRAGRCG